MMYTAANVQQQLVTTHGNKLRFLLSAMNNRSIAFQVGSISPGSIFSSNFFRVRDNLVLISDSAPNISEAADWALDGLREWAGLTRREAFAEISRDWAKNGDGRNNPSVSLGSTIDWLYLFSGATSARPTIGMFPLEADTSEFLIKMDLFNLYCWIFAGKWTASAVGPNRAMVPVSSVSIHPKYQDVLGALDDQTHHFAGYFEFGAHFPINMVSWTLKKALQKTGDVSGDIVVNPGDVNLGVDAAKWGDDMSKNPGYIGARVARDLVSGSSLTNFVRGSTFSL